MNLVPETVRIDMMAADDDRLARWQLDALNPNTGQLVERIGSGPLGASTWSQTFELRLGRFTVIDPPLSALQIVGTVTDRSGNTATETLLLELP